VVDAGVAGVGNADGIDAGMEGVGMVKVGVSDADRGDGRVDGAGVDSAGVGGGGWSSGGNSILPHTRSPHIGDCHCVSKSRISPKIFLQKPSFSEGAREAGGICGNKGGGTGAARDQSLAATEQPDFVNHTKHLTTQVLNWHHQHQIS